MADPAGGEERRVAELMRVNAELASEIRDLSEGRAEAPRSGPAPTARRLSKVEEERDALAGELEEIRAERDRLEHHNQELGRQIHERAVEVERLRSGLGGFVRRMRNRVLRRG